MSILHLILSFLALSNDISFWKQKVSFEGLSSNSIFLSTIMVLIHLLYVLDQRQTKMVIYILGAKIMLNVWKLSKMTKIRKHSKFPYIRYDLTILTNKILSTIPENSKLIFSKLENILIVQNL